MGSIAVPSPAARLHYRVDSELETPPPSGPPGWRAAAARTSPRCPIPQAPADGPRIAALAREVTSGSRDAQAISLATHRASLGASTLLPELARGPRCRRWRSSLREPLGNCGNRRRARRPVRSLASSRGWWGFHGGVNPYGRYSPCACGTPIPGWGPILPAPLGESRSLAARGSGCLHHRTPRSTGLAPAALVPLIITGACAPGRGGHHHRRQASTWRSICRAARVAAARAALAGAVLVAAAAGVSSAPAGTRGGRRRARSGVVHALSRGCSAPSRRQGLRPVPGRPRAISPPACSGPASARHPMLRADRGLRSRALGAVPLRHGAPRWRRCLRRWPTVVAATDQFDSPCLPSSSPPAPVACPGELLFALFQESSVPRRQSVVLLYVRTDLCVLPPTMFLSPPIRDAP